MSRPEPSAAVPAGIVIPHSSTGRRKLAAAAIYWLARGLMATWRCKATFAVEAADTSSPVIFCVWHNRLALSMVASTRFAPLRWPAPGLAALISASKDGGLLVSVLQRFHVQAVRGSSSRRGRQALLEATTWIERGYNVAITPDGPRGPRYVVQEGVVALAQVTGSPIVPVSIRVDGKIQLRSWDQFQLPLPFARCAIHFGAPIQVPRDFSEPDRKELRQRLQREMSSEPLV